MMILPNFLGTSFLIKPSTYEEISWVNGCNFCISKKKAEGLLFDEKLIMYALAEDRDFSYRLSNKGKIYFNPSMQLIHKVENVNRLPSKKKIFMIYVHQMYLTKKNLGWKFKNRFAYRWNIFGRIILTLFSCIRLKKESFINFGNNLLALFFVIKNKKEILSGELNKFHEFLKN
jgi:GT2 family glycosyltransferase